MQFIFLPVKLNLLGLNFQRGGGMAKIHSEKSILKKARKYFEEGFN